MEIMEVRRMTQEDDLSEISNIYEESWRYAYRDIVPQSFLDSIPKGRWSGRIIREGFYNLILTHNNRPVGTACYCRSRWEKYSDYGEIATIYLLPEYIGKGNGASLLKKCIDELKILGYDKILLWVLEDNHAARHFYEKHGFVCSEEFMDDNIGGKTLREVMYTLELE